MYENDGKATSTVSLSVTSMCQILLTWHVHMSAHVSMISGLFCWTVGPAILTCGTHPIACGGHTADVWTHLFTNGPCPADMWDLLRGTHLADMWDPLLTCGTRFVGAMGPAMLTSGGQTLTCGTHRTDMWVWHCWTMGPILLTCGSDLADLWDPCWGWEFMNQIMCKNALSVGVEPMPSSFNYLYVTIKPLRLCCSFNTSVPLKL